MGQPDPCAYRILHQKVNTQNTPECEWRPVIFEEIVQRDHFRKSRKTEIEIRSDIS
jgi:hypothetical protein